MVIKHNLTEHEITAVCNAIIDAETPNADTLLAHLRYNQLTESEFNKLPGIMKKQKKFNKDMAKLQREGSSLQRVYRNTAKLCDKIITKIDTFITLNES